MRLRLNLFGFPTISFNEKVIDSFASNKAIAILIYLVEMGQPVARERLLGLLWPDADVKKGRSSLRSALYSINKQMPDLLETTRVTVGLSDGVEVSADTIQLENASDPESLRVALSVIINDYLDGFYVGSADFDERTLHQREKWRELLVDGFEKLIEADTRSADFATVAENSRRLARLEPWREAHYRSWMLALGRIGRFDEALRVFQQCKRMVAEMDVEPLPETLRVLSRVRLARRMSGAHLPLTHGSFFGRSAELNQIDALLREGERLITIWGGGGMGKTRLSIEAADRQQRRFLNGAAFISLAGVTASTQESVAYHILSELIAGGYAQPTPHSRIVDHLVDQLSRLELLLVVDNFEHVLRAASLLALIQQRATDVTLLVTSRERLQLRSETVVPLRGLTNPAADLFIERAEQIAPSFAPTAEDRAAIAQICDATEGMPLAVELAARWVRVQSCAAIAAGLNELLVGNVPDLPDRHRSVRAAFAYSWQLLGEDERALLADLSLFRGGFSAEAANQVADAKTPQLVQLIDKSLLRFDRAAKRYDMHVLLRDFSAEKPRRVDSAERHSKHYLNRFIQKAREFTIGNADALSETDREFDNVRAAWFWAIDNGRLDTVLNALVAASSYFDFRVRFHTAYDFFQESIERAERLVVPDMLTIPKEILIAGLQNTCANFAVHLNRYADANQLITQSIEVFEQYGVLSGMAYGQFQFGRLLSKTNRLPRALDALTRSIVLFEQMNEPQGMAMVTTTRCYSQLVTGDYEGVKAGVEAARQVFEAVGDERGVAFGKSYLLRALAALNEDGDDVAAWLETHFEQTTLLTQVYAAVALGEYALSKKAWETAQKWLQITLDRCRQSDEFDVRLDALFALANLQYQQGQPEQITPLLAQFQAFPRNHSRLPIVRAIMQRWRGDEIDVAATRSLAIERGLTPLVAHL